MNRISKGIISWSLFEYQNWQFYLAATSKGLCYVGSPNSPFDELKNWVMYHFPQDELKKTTTMLEPCKTEFREYLQGKRETFTFPVDIRGTEFQQKIWHTLNQIPYGATYTYTQIAELAQRPSAVRAVGTAIGANPVLISVPCHRVIGKNGKLTGYRGGLEMKKQLLHLEKKL
ncbi:cysteine methyltransferase [Virgibacillus phasianinus]|uniref:methylated-DNA--[protein]-cysteine S-methyltransferase n=1 Tax=Virgibacillus phasianinus TaxID=2017483 RepID=A0A220TZ59_9BACI|nr:methylated-DNA--[protein]-cysteine S-methyltransferase [Virgibacillus phasianinus]ASK60956.1 cysteine methyltransferase [Virgibacillus phasianinus]